MVIRMRFYLLLFLVCLFLSGCGVFMTPPDPAVRLTSGPGSDLYDAYTNCGKDAACYKTYIEASNDGWIRGNAERKFYGGRGQIRVNGKSMYADGTPSSITYGEHPRLGDDRPIQPPFCTLTLDYAPDGRITSAEYVDLRGKNATD